MSELKPYQKTEPRKPIEGNWELMADPPEVTDRMEGYRYVSPLGIQVISSVHIVENSDGGGFSPHYHISISDAGRRCAQWVAERVLKQFGASDFEEDNHAPQKIIRSFWKPVSGPAVECPCKDEVKPEIDGDYTWREK